MTRSGSTIYNLSFHNHSLKNSNQTQMQSILPTHSTSVTLYIIAILIIYVIIFVALIISNFVTDHDFEEENQEEIKKYYSSGLRGRKSNRIRNLFISYNNSNLLNDINEPFNYLNNWTNKFKTKKPIRYCRKQFKDNELLDAQTECLL